jgi:Flp pilus assembly protein TadD
MSDSPDIRELLRQAASAGESGDLTRAEGCCREALALDAGNADALGLMGMVRWHGGDVDEGERFLRQSLAIMPAQAHVLANLGDLLVSRQAHDSALDGQGRVSGAVESFTAAVELAPEDVKCRQDLARVLISTGDYRGALGHIDAAIELAPLDQRNLAFRGLCWRLSGDPRAAIINDYARFVKRYEIPVPEGYADIRAFNVALAGALDALHRTQVQHPLNQTLRGGTQTHGNLFERKPHRCKPGRIAGASLLANLPAPEDSRASSLLQGSAIRPGLQRWG